MKERKGPRKAKEQSTNLLHELGLVPRDEVARATGRSVRMLKRDAMLRRGPRPVVYGKTTYYLKRQLVEYFERLAEGRNGS